MDHPGDTQPDSYGQVFADVYDQWYSEVTDAEATAQFVVDHLLSDRPTPVADGRVLELGVGTGRLARPLLDRGVTVWGLDASLAMLHRCAATAPGCKTFAADLANFALAGVFDVVLIGFNTLFNLVEEQAQRRLFHTIANVLAPHGVFVVEAFDPTMLLGGDGGDGDGGEGGEGDHYPAARDMSLRSVDHHGVTVVASANHPTEQIIEGAHWTVADRGVTVRPWRIRWATPDQIDAWANDAGLFLAARYRDWHRNPFVVGATGNETHISIYSPITQTTAPTA